MESEFMRKMREQAIAKAEKIERDMNQAKLRGWKDMERMYREMGWTERQIADEKASVAKAVYSGPALNGLGAITRDNFAASFQQSGLSSKPELKEVYDYLGKYTKGFTDWRIIDASASVREVYEGLVAKLEAEAKPAPAENSRIREIANQNPNIIITRGAPLPEVEEPKPTSRPKFQVGDVVKRMPGTASETYANATGTIKSEGDWMKRFRGQYEYHYRVQWDYTHVMEANAPESVLMLANEKQPTVAQSDPERYVNEGKAAIRELLADSRKKSTSKTPKAVKKSKPEVEVLKETIYKTGTKAPKIKPKFKKGQYAVIVDSKDYPTQHGIVGRIEDVHILNDTYFSYYAPEWKVMIPEPALEPASKKEYDAYFKDRDYDGSKKTMGTSEEQKHFKALIKNTSATTKDSITKAYKALQRAITSGKIRKGSPNADLVMQAQKAYYNALKEGSPYRVKLTDADLAKYVYLVNGLKIYRSVRAMSYLIGQYDQEMSPQRVAAVVKYLENLRVPKSEPFADRVFDTIDFLKSHSKKGLKVGYGKSIDLQGLGAIETLMGLGFACGCGGAGSAKPMAGLGSLDDIVPPKQTMPAAKMSMTSHELEKLHYATYPFMGKWAELIGEPQTNFALMIWGSPGAGKSTLAMQFSKYLAEHHGNVLYVSSEEFPSYTLKNKLNLVGGASHGWEFSKTLDALRPEHKFLVIDSTNHYRFTTADLKALKARRPDLSIILIVQITKGGNFKGDQSLEHEVDAVVKVTRDGAATVKNRFKELSSVPVFDEY